MTVSRIKQQNEKTTINFYYRQRKRPGNDVKNQHLYLYTLPWCLPRRNALDSGTDTYYT